MVYLEIDKFAVDDFWVYDEDGSPVSGLLTQDFEIDLYNPSQDQVANISGGVLVSIIEVGSGLYRTSFVPNVLGDWTLALYNASYFALGKGQNYACVTNIGENPETKEKIDRILGLSQENYRLVNPQYDRAMNLVGGTIKIYPTANDVDTDTNTIAEYSIKAVFNRQNQMTDYRVKRI